MPLFSTRQKVTIAKLLNRTIRAGRSIARKPMRGVFTRNGLRWYLDLNEGIDFAIYLLGAFERDLVRCYKKLIKPGDVVLDIGANIGAHTLPLARAVGPAGHVVAIEATEYAIEKLQGNLALNPELVSRVSAVHCLLVADVNAPSETHIYSSWPLTGEAPVHPVLSGALKAIGDARTCTVDQLVGEMNIPSIQWVKLDVDGHELSVLLGADKMIGSHHPGIMMELAPYCYVDTPGQFEALVQWLYRADYSLFDAQSDRRLPRDIGALERSIPKGGSINILARHIEGHAHK